MAQYKRLPHKKAKKGDQFVSLVDRFLHLLRPYRTQTIAVVLIGLSLFAGWLMLGRQQEKTLLHFNEALYEAEKSKKIEAYQILLEQYPKQNTPLHLAIAHLLLDEGKHTEALQHLEKVGAAIPKDFSETLQLSKAHLFWDEGKPGDALNLIASTADENQAEEGAYTQLLRADLLLAQDKSQEAMKLYEAIAKNETQSDPVIDWAKGRIVWFKTQYENK